MWVVGTAGHVDHGKSSLVKALTGIDPDRLKEEKQRQMTIDLGFAWYSYPTGEEVGIIDVPGHRDFIENMLAGVGGIDAVLFVVAADEGIMPQTREHLAIIDLLKTRRGLVVMTKIDRVNDPGWIDLIENDIREVVKGTVLENSQIFKVSSTIGTGIEELRQGILELLRNTPAKTDVGKPRLPVDRIFSIPGFGTVVTGTLLDGKFQVGDLVQIMPDGLQARIRGLQSHNQQEQVAHPGSRTAINLSGVEVSQIDRGDVVVHPGDLQPSRLIDAKLELLPGLDVVIRHNAKLKLFIGSAERICRVRLLGIERLSAGENGFAQIEFEHPIVAADIDRFIIRRISPPETIGGGVVLNPNPEGRYKLYAAGLIEKLSFKESNTPEDNVYHWLDEHDAVSLNEIVKVFLSRFDQIEHIVQVLVNSKRVIEIPAGDKTVPLLTTSSNFYKTLNRLMIMIDNFHKQNPLVHGARKNDLSKRLGQPLPVFKECLQQGQLAGKIRIQNGNVSLPDFKVSYSPGQSKRIATFWQEYEKDPYNPLSSKESKEILGDELYESLLDNGEIVPVSKEVIFSENVISDMTDFVINKCADGVILTVGEFRDHFSTSRKYALAFLEYLDRLNITTREGEGRRLATQK